MTDASAQFYYKNNRLQQLRGFFYTAQQGTVSKAAAHLSLQQSTVSMQIQSLERDLKVKLFTRSGPRLRLSEDGETLYRMALPMIEGMDSLFARFLEKRTLEQQRTISIATNQVTAAYLLPAILAEYRQQFPNIEILLHDLPLKDALKMLLNDEVDLVIGSFIDVPKALHYTPAYIFDTVLVTPLHHPLAVKKSVTLEDIAEYDLVRIAPHLITVPLFEEMCAQFKLGSNLKLMAGDWTMLKQFVRHGLGVCVISNICMQAEDEDLYARPLNEYFGKLTYGAVVKRGKALHPAVRDLIKTMEFHAGMLAAKVDMAQRRK